MSKKVHLQLPEPLASIPRANLLYPFSSPIHPLQNLTNTSAASTLGSGSAQTQRERTLSRPGRKIETLKGPRKVQISLYAKREDHSSPLACAGNKYRKLEYIVPDVLAARPRFGAGRAADFPVDVSSGSSSGFAQGSANANANEDGNGNWSEKNGTKGPVTTLVTEGAIQSNHTVQVASVASRIGLEAVVILHKGTGGGLSQSPAKDSFLRTGNVQVVKLLGADVRMLESPPEGSSKTQHTLVDEVLDDLRGHGKVPYWIPSGASLHPLGALGYARGAFEIAAQEEELFAAGQRENGNGPGGSRFDYIFVACGSGSTVAGLIAGFKYLEKTDLQSQSQSQSRQGQNQTRQRASRPRRVIGIMTSPTKPKAYHEDRILRFARRAGEMIGLNSEDITMDDVNVDDRFVGEGYGVLDGQTKEALSYMAEKEEVMLDPVYTAKVTRGMMHWVGDGEIERDVLGEQEDEQKQKQVNAVFIHTGGQSALGAYADI